MDRKSLTAFSNSPGLGVTTLQLDTRLTEDGKVVVWHDDTIQATRCNDTAPATPGYPAFPYVCDRVAELSVAQIKTLNWGFVQLPGYPARDVIEGNRIPEFKDFYQLIRDTNAEKVRFNVETKVESSGVGGIDIEDYNGSFPERQLCRGTTSSPLRSAPSPVR